MNSGYRMMWMMVLFDLPVGTPQQRKDACKFRNILLDHGFEMSQFSVYLKYCGDKERAETIMRQVESEIPCYGKVTLMTFTDKQFANSRAFYGKLPQKNAKKPPQYELF